MIEDVRGKEEISTATLGESLEERLERTKRIEVLSQMVGSLIHDFNNILTVVHGSVDYLDATLPPFASHLREEVEGLRAQAIRGRSLVRKLLSFGRKEELKYEALHPHEVLKGIYPTLRRLIPAHTKMEFSAQPSLPRILADRGALEHVILNLCANAKDAMPTGGTLSLRLSNCHPPESAPKPDSMPATENGYVRLVVQDSGIGMGPETLDRIFQPFFTTKGDQGSGLGMNMVLDLVEGQGGFLEVESEVSEGTRISIYLPATSEPESPIDLWREEGELPGGNHKVLVVDDEQRLRQGTARALGLLGYTVLTAENGAKALDLLRRQKGEVDLVISDVVMPEVGGFEVRKTLAEEGDPVPVLLVSGHSDTDLQRLALWDPSAPLLKKPWELPALARSVRDLLNGAGGSVAGSEEALSSTANLP